MGKEPFPQGRSVSGADGVAPDDAVAACKWSYQCSVCLLAGDLLCCEHPDGCAVSVHPECTGQPFPEGPWICTNHDDRRLKTRIRRRGSAGRGLGDDDGGDDGDSEATVSEDSQKSGADSDATEDYEGGSGGRAKRRRGR